MWGDVAVGYGGPCAGCVVPERALLTTVYELAPHRPLIVPGGTFAKSAQIVGHEGDEPDPLADVKILA